MRLLVLLLCNVFVMCGTNGTGSSCCPTAEIISPCTCSVNDDSLEVDLDCSAVNDEDHLAEIFQRQLPCKNFRALQIWYNYNIKRLSAGTFSDITFEEINLWDGGLKTVDDDTFSSMAHTLNMISIERQQLESFPFYIIKNLSNLTVLDLTSNKITNFPEFLSSGNLEVLTLANNPLQKLPENPFDLLPKLNAVDLGNSQIKVLPKELFINNPEMQYVMLRCNNIKNLTRETFSFSSNKMEWLELRWNIVRFVEEGAFDGMEAGYQKPAYIDLWDNYITTLDENIWRPLMEKKVGLLMEDNALECGCDVAWYVNTEEFHHLVHDAVCASGEYLNDLDPELFTDC